MKLSSYYRDCFGTLCPPRVQRELNSFLHVGMEEGVILEAMDEASIAPRPSWLYARAILSRCHAEGVHTVDAYYERQIRRRGF